MRPLSGSARTPGGNVAHGDPRWLPFLRKIGMAPEQMGAIRFEVRLSPGVDAPAN
ncbi:MAG: hypothetical protein ACOH1L_02380 [Thermomonas sp.]